MLMNSNHNGLSYQKKLKLPSITENAAFVYKCTHLVSYISPLNVRVKSSKQWGKYHLMNAKVSAICFYTLDEKLISNPENI